jgi:hypothetical protein
MLVPLVDACAVPDVNTPTPVGVPAVTGEVNVGVVSDKLDAKYVELIDPAVAGMAFNTLETYKLMVVTVSPAVQPLFKTTVVPVVAV